MTKTVLIVFAFVALLLAACSSGGGADSLRATAQAAGVVVPSSEGSAPAEQPTAQPTEQPATEPARSVDVQQVEVTRIVEVTQPAQIIETTRVVIVTATPLPTPDIQGFQDSGIDESVQPCPIKFWKRGRCVANDATVESYANEVQP